MADSAALWDAINDMRERLVRLEERGIARDAGMTAMSGKLDKIVTMAAQAEGAGKAAALFGKWGYGVAAGLVIAAISNWEKIRKAIF